MDKDTDVRTSIATDPTISLRALGLYVYIKNKPPGWKFSSFRIMQQKADGRDSIRNAIKELDERGYLERHKEINEKGQFVGYQFSLLDPETGKPALASPAPEKATPIHNKMYSLKGVSDKSKKPASPDIDKKKFEQWAAEQNLFNPNVIDKHYKAASEGAVRWIRENPEKADKLHEDCIKSVMNRNPGLSRKNSETMARIERKFVLIKRFIDNKD